MNPDDIDEVLAAVDALRSRVAALERRVALLAEDSDFDDDPEFDAPDALD
jgi:ubiquinone biosynthesis protein UbiJ